MVPPSRRNPDLRRSPRSPRSREVPPSPLLRWRYFTAVLYISLCRFEILREAPTGRRCHQRARLPVGKDRAQRRGTSSCAICFSLFFARVAFPSPQRPLPSSPPPLTFLPRLLQGRIIIQSSLEDSPSPQQSPLMSSPEQASASGDHNGILTVF